MKKIILGGLLLASFLGYSQEKWRELSFANVSGVTVDGHVFNTFSASLSYELAKNFSITSWNGLSYNFYNKNNWVASQTTIDKRIKKLTIGAGFQYGTGTIVQFVQPVNFRENMYIVGKIQYRIKL
jgi:hypothetical protein